MAEYMVDTDICIAVLKHNRPVIDKFIEHQGKVYVSSISCYELQFGIEKGDPEHRQGKESKLSFFLEGVNVIDFDGAAARESAKVREELQRGQQIGAYDTLLAAHARSRGMVMVTHNQREFSRVPGLQLADWLG
ncbi:PIN domain-containing protein [Endozoicomonas sp. GU-1]|uniref:PIN domain-containing protein n=2 Tax=Endozoicomonas sp. GU-1 TaxID=3009078 RepID=UPI0022B3882D|nr:PIN domain-containing protein [Endozoicomonas sp. GU-1]WBA84396.1 PIN domain-containing protein [Endozoicomonas sp. GU-1]